MRLRSPSRPPIHESILLSVNVPVVVLVPGWEARLSWLFRGGISAELGTKESRGARSSARSRARAETSRTGVRLVRPKARAAVFALAAALALGVTSCGSSAPTTPFVDVDVAATAANPDNVPYPTDHLGTRARAKGRFGDRITNFAFQGYVDGDPKGTLKTVSMADFYDPEAKRHRVLQIQGVAGWCPVCAAEAKQTMGDTETALRAEGAVVVQILNRAGLRPRTRAGYTADGASATIAR